MKLIREARMGPPKSFKSGAVFGSYPKPLLALMFDNGGLTVLPSKNAPPNKDLVVMDTTYEDVVFIKPEELPTWLLKPESEQPRILAIDYNAKRSASLKLDTLPLQDSSAMQAFVSNMDQLFKHAMGGKPWPWKTAVLDSLTGYMDVIVSFIAQHNISAMADARQWAFQVGTKVKQTVGAMDAFPCHTVLILHSEIEKNETTGVVSELPSVYSKLRNDIGGLFSQFFYALKKNGKPYIWTTDQQMVRGIGPRWPQGLPSECAPDFKSIYGKELQ